MGISSFLKVEQFELTRIQIKIFGILKRRDGEKTRGFISKQPLISAKKVKNLLKLQNWITSTFKIKLKINIKTRKIERLVTKKNKF